MKGAWIRKRCCGAPQRTVQVCDDVVVADDVADEVGVIRPLGDALALGLLSEEGDDVEEPVELDVLVAVVVELEVFVANPDPELVKVAIDDLVALPARD